MKLGLEKRGERSLFTATMMNEFIWQSKMSKCNSRHCQSTNRGDGFVMPREGVKKNWKWTIITSKWRMSFSQRVTHPLIVSYYCHILSNAELTLTVFVCHASSFCDRIKEALMTFEAAGWLHKRKRNVTETTAHHTSLH